MQAMLAVTLPPALTLVHSNKALLHMSKTSDSVRMDVRQEGLQTPSTALHALRLLTPRASCCRSCRPGGVRLRPSCCC